MGERGAGERALTIAISASGALAVLKLGVGVLSGSMVVLASAADSFADAAMSALNRWGYRLARSPADSDHPWGHGKIEGALAAGQGLMLWGIVASLSAGALTRLADPVMPELGVAVGVLILSGAVSGGLAWALLRASAGQRSLVLKSDAAHYQVDLLTHAAAVLGLVAVLGTGLAWLDPVIALVMASLMAREAWAVLRGGVAELMDEALPPEELAAVQAVLDRNAGRVLGFHDLRTRRGGPRAFVEVHAVLSPKLPLGEAHQLVQDICRQIRAALPGARVLVHPDAGGLEDIVE